MVLELHRVSKAFPGVQALLDVTLEVRAGSVHAITGENGAGKSTLMKIIGGLLAPDSGEVRFRGRAVHLRHPHDAMRMGISMIHQELLPFADLTVAENVCMGREPTRWFPLCLDKPAMNREAGRLLGRLGVAVSPARKMRHLSVAEMQAVEIARALGYAAGVIIMDEPTSALSQRESQALFAAIRDLKARGVAVLYISHKLEEIFQLADTVTVLRDGRHVATHPVDEVDERGLIRLMVGRDVPASAGAAAAHGSVALEVAGLSRRGKFRDVGFRLHRGEILGIAGLMGAGRTELVSAIFGLAPAESGEIRVRGRAVRIASPADALGHGIAMVGEDRQALGLVPGMAVAHNITLASLRRYCRGLVIDGAAEQAAALEQMRALGIRASGAGLAVRHLSGGNQQKVVIAKALLTRPDILILDEPTRGIDVAAKAEVHQMMRRLAQEGKAILMVSSEIPEILSLSDRILVMRGGAVSAALDARSTHPEEILHYAMPSPEKDAPWAS